MIESVFNVKPLAARETSNTVGNLLSVINLSNPPVSAPTLPQPQPVPPQTLCLSSINPGGGLRPIQRGDDEPNTFQRLEKAARLRGWSVYP
jgi:hypothetical protein